MGQLLSERVINAAINPLLYITDGESEGIKVGENVTFESHVTGGGVPGYTYEWSVRKEGDSSWAMVGGNSFSWIWNPGSEYAGSYNIRCRITDSLNRTGEVVWEDFVVSET